MTLAVQDGLRPCRMARRTETGLSRRHSPRLRSRRGSFHARRRRLPTTNALCCYSSRRLCDSSCDATHRATSRMTLTCSSPHTSGILSRAMHWLGTCTAQTFNTRYERSGHLYQGRFGSRLVEDDDYLLELARYVPLNPVRAALCESPEEWPWSSYAATSWSVHQAPGSCTPSALPRRPLGSPDAYAAWVTDGILSTRLDEHGVPRPPPRPTLTTLLAHPL